MSVRLATHKACLADQGFPTPNKEQTEYVLREYYRRIHDLAGVARVH